MIKRILADMPDLEARKHKGLISIDRVSRDPEDVFMFTLKRFDGETGDERDPEIHETTITALEAEEARFQRQIDQMFIKIANLKTIRMALNKMTPCDAEMV